jgi:hypothetical protein
MKVRLKLFGKIYLHLASIYGLWAMILLQFKECGFFGTTCTPFFTQIVTVVIAAFRGISWLPELVIALLRGEFLDWLLLRNFYAPPVRILVQKIVESIWGGL